MPKKPTQAQIAAALKDAIKPPAQGAKKTTKLHGRLGGVA